MNCNWELYELRVRVFTDAKTFKKREKGMPVGTGTEFFNITLYTEGLGLEPIGPARPNDSCDMKSTFGLLALFKTIPFGFSSAIGTSYPKHTANPTTHFGLMEKARLDKTVFPAAFLYIHRRDTSAAVDPTDVALLLENVTVFETSSDKNKFYVSLHGNSAQMINF